MKKIIQKIKYWYLAIKRRRQIKKMIDREKTQDYIYD
jgi:hypothetical protein